MKNRFVFLFSFVVALGISQLLGAQNSFNFLRILDGCVIVSANDTYSEFVIVDTIYCDDCTVIGDILYTQSYLQAIDTGGSVVLSKFKLSNKSISLLDRHYSKLPANVSFKKFSFTLEGLNFLIIKHKYGITPEKQLAFNLLDDNSLIDFESKICDFIEENSDVQK